MQRHKAFLHAEDRDGEYQGMKLEYPGGQTLWFQSGRPLHDYMDAVYTASKTQTEVVKSASVDHYLETKENR